MDSDRVKIVDDFLEKLKGEGVKQKPIGELLEKFKVTCKKCGSEKIFGSKDRLEYFDPYGDSGQFVIVIKCADCGNAFAIEEEYSFSSAGWCDCSC